jgi:hypothetical protein
MSINNHHCAVKEAYWEVVPELSWARTVGGFAITSVMVWMLPLLNVDVNVDVI